MSNKNDQKPVDHPIVNYYMKELINEVARCNDSDCDPCDYEAN